MSEDQLTRLFGDLTVVQLILGLVSASALIFFIVKLWPAIVKFVATVNALSDLPAKLALVDEIHHEVRPNTGTSMNDAMRRTEARVIALEAQVAEQSGKIDGLQVLMESGDSELAERVDDLENTLTPKEP